MKTKLIAAVSAGVAAVAVVTLIAGVATAGVGSPTSPYPNVPINPKVCKVQAADVKAAQAAYNEALANYKSWLNLFNRTPPAASRYQLNTAQQALDKAVIALDNARYAQATCQNNAANPKDKVCVNLALELNRLLDELPVTQDLQAIAADNLNMALKLWAYVPPRISATALNADKAAYAAAVAATEKLEAQIENQEKAVSEAGCKNAVRPKPTPTKSSTTPSSPSPSPSRSGSPTSTPTPMPSTTTAIPS